MSLLRVMLGPCPCHTCKRPVMWVRHFDGITLFEVFRDSLGRRIRRPHECQLGLDL